MSQSLQLNIKSSILDRERQLKIDENCIEFDDRDLKTASPTVFLKNDIAGVRYGVEWIHGYRFIIGRTYCVDVLDNNNTIIKIRLKSVYGVRKEKLFEKYSKIVNVLHDNFIIDISITRLRQFAKGNDLFIAGIRISQTGVILKDKSDLITWLNTGIKKYSNYFAVHSISNPERHKTIDYLTEWEAGILYYVLYHIIKIKSTQDADNIISNI